MKQSQEVKTEKLHEVEIKNNLLCAFDKTYRICKDSELTESDKSKYPVKYEYHGFINVIFESELSFLEFYNKCIQTKYNGLFFHEKLYDNKPVKLFFDIDITEGNETHNLEYYDLKRSIFISKILSIIAEKIHSKQVPLKCYTKVIIASNNRETKKSYRLIYPDIVFSNMKQLKNFMLNHFSEYNNIIDLGVYKPGQLRLIYSTKIGVKKYMKLRNRKNYNSFDDRFLIMSSIRYDNTYDVPDKELIDYKISNKISTDYIFSYSDLSDILNSVNPEILNMYILKNRDSTGNHYRLNNKGEAKCLINEGISHSRDNSYLNINKKGDFISISVTCYKCKNNKNLKGYKRIKSFRIERTENEKKTKKSFYKSLMEEHIKNPKPKIKFKDFKQIFTDKVYLDLEDIKDYINDCIYLSLYCGGGKTTITAKIINYLIHINNKRAYKHNNLYVLFITCRRTLSNQIKQNINKALGELNDKNDNDMFESYMKEDEQLIKEFKSNFRIISPESIDKLCGDLIGPENEHKKVYVINEEAPHLIKQFNSVNTHKQFIKLNQSTYEELNKKAFGICCLSGTPDKYTSSYIHNLTNLDKYAFDFNIKKSIKELIIYKDTEKTKIRKSLFDKIDKREFPILIGWFDGVSESKIKKVSKIEVFKTLLNTYANVNITMIYSGSDAAE
jgi:hypothetical protein